MATYLAPFVELSSVKAAGEVWQEIYRNSVKIHFMGQVYTVWVQRTGLILIEGLLIVHNFQNVFVPSFYDINFWIWNVYS